MYLIKISINAEIIINKKRYRFTSGGTNRDGSFEGTFESCEGDDPIMIETPPKSAIAKSDSLNDLCELIS